jgi:L,D-peptidoglycan transpeptidase YkuD (ErfK/YbiS/YcfS/YnhG family)
LGSAIFLHVAAAGYAPTEGCVALAIDDLVHVIALCDATTRIRILDR